MQNRGQGLSAVLSPHNQVNFVNHAIPKRQFQQSYLNNKGYLYDQGKNEKNTE
jgi:hypothetical protein